MTNQIHQKVELRLPRCPQCSIAVPHLIKVFFLGTKNANGGNERTWSVYRCESCGGLVLVESPGDGNAPIRTMWPSLSMVADDLPDRAREYLMQAIESLHAPAGAVILAASCIDAMLKEKNYRAGSLKARIDEAARDHLITQEMATWAHDIRLDANDQRHSDETAPLPSELDAQRAIEFAQALAQFLYVLPARVMRGRSI